MDTQNLADHPAFSGFKSRLHTMGSTAVGAAAVLTSILTNQALFIPGGNGKLPAAPEKGNQS